MFGSYWDRFVLKVLANEAVAFSGCVRIFYMLGSFSLVNFANCPISDMGGRLLKTVTFDLKALILISSLIAFNLIELEWPTLFLLELIELWKGVMTYDLAKGR
jgi:hypothetical protein